MSHKISQIIVTCCQKEGIHYTSCNPAYVNFEEDSIRLRDLYLQLKEVIGELQEISDRHGLSELKELFNKNIESLNNTDHDLIKIAIKLKDKK